MYVDGKRERNRNEAHAPSSIPRVVVAESPPDTLRQASMSDEDDLARRLAALRGGNAALKKQPTTVPHQKQDEEDEQLSRRLASLETPSDNSSSKGQDVIVETKNLDDDAVRSPLSPPEKVN